jgi:hypothetical protein
MMMVVMIMIVVVVIMTAVVMVIIIRGSRDRRQGYGRRQNECGDDFFHHFMLFQ